ncbi:cell envelope integrity protein TolA [Pigmentibacter sp. JX0631]|uniref:cell envelope integrity protein TolA n=1 Tax=Pigmentibacter sp. JX0631 TaxID=2976982 RepID=UPI0024688BFB|nr:cell envelope integrity protein TolA [Pigmentibacter sp. JX0631]WGL61396.1 cell envelope integrity protein TolA [Pigmentibacter sp. JX0631]
MNDYKNIHLDLKSYRFPEVDEKNMIKFNKSTYSAKANIYFSNPDKAPFIDHSFSGPRYIKINELPLNKRIKQPLIDIKSNSFKIPFLSPLEIKGYYKTGQFYFLIALVVHFLFVSSFFISAYVSKITEEKPEIVEVTFGLNENAAQTVQNTTDKNEGETEATKTIRELQQLTKNIAPDTSPNSEEKNEAIDNPNSDLVYRENDRKKVAEKKDPKEKMDKDKPIGPLPDQDKQKVKLDDFLKRKELDTRKESTKKADGIREKNLAKPEGAKIEKNAIPKSPFASPSDIPDSPFAEAPSGVLEGKVSSISYNSYKAYIGRQLKQNWSVSEGSSFNPALKARIEFTVNPYGHLIGKPKVVKSSGNKEFDQLALSAVESTFPLSQPPPKDINPPKSFEAMYTPKDVR